jgi:Na+/proline symporter
MSIVWLIIIVVVYLAVIGYLGYVGFKKTKSASDYMVGGRKIHPFIMALSYGATFISTSAIIGFGGLASRFGMSLLWLTVCNIGVGIFIAFVVYGKRTRRMGLNLDAHTFPEFLGRRLDSKFIQWFAGLIIFIFMPLYAAAVLIGGAQVLTVLTNIPYDVGIAIFGILVAAYVMMGGLKGVMYTDAVQAVLMFVGMIILLVGIYVMLGGITPAHQKLTELKPSLVGIADTKTGGLLNSGGIQLTKMEVKDNVTNTVSVADVYGGMLDVEARLGKLYTKMTNAKVNQLSPELLGELKLLADNNAKIYASFSGIAPTNGNVQLVKRYGETLAAFNLKLNQLMSGGGGTNDIKGLIQDYGTIVYNLKMVKIGKMGVPAGGWTASPPSGSPLWWVIFSTIVLGVGIGVLAQPQLVVRFMTVKSNQQLNRAILIGGIFILVTVGTAFIVGALSNVYFFEKFGSVSVALAGGNHDQVIPKFIATALPEWFGYLFMLVILSAGMSTLSSQFHTIGTSFGRDFFENGIMANAKEKEAKKETGKPTTLRTVIIFALAAIASVGIALMMNSAKMQVLTIILVLVFAWLILIFLTFYSKKDQSAKGSGGVLATRIGILVGILLTIVLGLKLEDGIIARATAIFFGLMASSFLAPYTASLFWKKLTRKGAIAGIIAGVSGSAIAFLFFHAKEAAYFGVCQAIFGKPFLIAEPFASVDPLVLALPVSIIFTIVVSLLTKVENPKTVDAAFKGIGKN